MTPDLIFLLVAFVICALALVLGPTPIAVRAVLHPAVGHKLAQRFYQPIGWGFSIGVLVAIAAVGITLGGELGLWAALLPLLTMLVCCDARWRWLPLPWTGAILVLGLAHAITFGDITLSIVAAAISSTILLLLRFAYLRLRNVEALGLGDVWLVAGFATFLGPEWIFLLLFTASLTGLTTALASKITGKQGAKRYGVDFGTHLCLNFPILYFWSL